MCARFVLNTAYAFASPLPIDRMYEVLTASSPWRWWRRENDSYGDYLWASTGAEPSVLRIIEENGDYIIDVEFQSEEPDGRAACDALHRRIRDQLLPALGATDVRAAPHHGR